MSLPVRQFQTNRRVATAFRTVFGLTGCPLCSSRPRSSTNCWTVPAVIADSGVCLPMSRARWFMWMSSIARVMISFAPVVN